MLLVEHVQWVSITLLLKIRLDLAELLAEFAVEDLVLEDIFEVRADVGTVKLQRAVQLSVLRDTRMVLELHNIVSEISPGVIGHAVPE